MKHTCQNCNRYVRIDAKHGECELCGEPRNISRHSNTRRACFSARKLHPDAGPIGRGAARILGIDLDNAKVDAPSGATAERR